MSVSVCAHTRAHTSTYLLLGKGGLSAFTYRKSLQRTVIIQKLSQQGIVTERQHSPALYLWFQGLAFALAKERPCFGETVLAKKTFFDICSLYCSGGGGRLMGNCGVLPWFLLLLLMYLKTLLCYLLCAGRQVYKHTKHEQCMRESGNVSESKNHIL